MRLNIPNSDQALLYMMDGLLTPSNTATVESLEKVFVFCMIWSMGSSLTVSDDGTDYQKLFSDWWRNEWKKVSQSVLDRRHGREKKHPQHTPRTDNRHRNWRSQFTPRCVSAIFYGVALLLSMSSAYFDGRAS